MAVILVLLSTAGAWFMYYKTMHACKCYIADLVQIQEYEQQEADKSERLDSEKINGAR